MRVIRINTTAWMEEVMTVELSFKTEKGLYKNFVKTFKDERHMNNYIDKMEREFGWKHIGTT